MDSRFCGACSNPERSRQISRRAIQLRADDHHPKSDAEREGYEALYAYQAVLSAQKGKNTRASGTWPMVRDHGILGAIERIVTKGETEGYRLLVQMGMEDLAFEAVVTRHPESFSPEAVKASKKRLKTLKGVKEK
jgi:hypothetical protein